MGLQEVAGWLLIVNGVLGVGPALPVLVRATRSEARPGVISAGVWSRFLAGLGVLAGGILYLRYPHDRHSLDWLPGALAAAGVIFLIVSWTVSGRKAKRLDASSEYTPELSSADTPGPGPAVVPDARTAGLIERIKNVKFSTVRLTPGYDEEEVDNFLDRLVAGLSESGQVDRLELRNIKFSTTRLRPGYTMPDVDSFLDEVAQATW